MLPDASVRDVVVLAERLQAAPRVAGSGSLVRSVSAGAVEWTLFSTPAVLIAEAVRLVYESKRHGGGRVSVAAHAEAG